MGDRHDPFNFKTKSLSACARIRSSGELIVFKISKIFSFYVKHSTPIYPCEAAGNISPKENS